MLDSQRHSRPSSLRQLVRPGVLSILALTAAANLAIAQVGPMSPSPSVRNRVCTLFGGAGEERVQGVWILANGHILVAGETSSTDFATQFPIPPLPYPQPFDKTHNGGRDA